MRKKKQKHTVTVFTLKWLIFDWINDIDIEQ